MPLYEPIVKQVEAHRCEDGSYLARFDGEWVEMSADDFEGAYQLVEAKAGKASRDGAAATPRAGTRAKGEATTARARTSRKAPAKPTADATPAAPRKKGGRKPQHWRCRCGAEASGQKCASCGKRKAVAAVADLPTPPVGTVPGPKLNGASPTRRAEVAAALDAGWMQ